MRSPWNVNATGAFFFNGPATTEIYTLSLHDALPIFPTPWAVVTGTLELARDGTLWERSEEHTSELQSCRDLVCRLLLEKKKNATECTKMSLSPQNTAASTPTTRAMRAS